MHQYPHGWIIEVYDPSTRRAFDVNPYFTAASFEQALVMLPAIARTYLAHTPASTGA